jgi:hypothetical protein
MHRLPTIALMAALVMTASGCGGGGGNGDSKGGTGGTNQGTSVVVTPSGMGQVWQGTKVQFAAQVIGKPTRRLLGLCRKAAQGA